MLVELPVGDYAAFLWMAVATHALVGYTLGRVLFDEPAWGVLGAVVADVDLFFPLAWQPALVHRGITHTALAAVLLAVLVARGNRAAGVAVGVAYASHLLIDATTPAGVPLFYPVSSARFGVSIGGHSRVATLVLWAGCLALLYQRRRRRSENRSIS